VVAQSFVAVSFLRRDEVAYQRPIGPRQHRHIRRSAAQHDTGVAGGPFERGVAVDRGDGGQVGQTPPRREEQRDGVVYAGVRIDDDADAGRLRRQ
jgi:hypothetical protein